MELEKQGREGDYYFWRDSWLKKNTHTAVRASSIRLRDSNTSADKDHSACQQLMHPSVQHHRTHSRPGAEPAGCSVCPPWHRPRLLRTQRARQKLQLGLPGLYQQTSRNLRAEMWKKRGGEGEWERERERKKKL